MAHLPRKFFDPWLREAKSSKKETSENIRTKNIVFLSFLELENLTKLDFVSTGLITLPVTYLLKTLGSLKVHLVEN